MKPNNVARLRTEHCRSKYEIVETLGAGGSGVVYKAFDVESNQWLALKLLAPPLQRDPIARARFADEARLASALDHPNLCTVLGAQMTDSGDLVIVMRYYRGPTLKRRLQRGALPVSQAIAVAAQIADGLAYLHRRMIAHGDIKPSNIIVTNGKITILDFGLANTLQSPRGSWATAMMPGTAAYMSPEQTRGRRADVCTDLWALGAVLFEMLTGSTPFGGPYPEAIAYAVRHHAPPAVSRLRVGIPAGLDRIVRKLLEKNPFQRYASAAALASELRSLPIERRPTDIPVSRFEVAA